MQEELSCSSDLSMAWPQVWGQEHYLPVVCDILPWDSTATYGECWRICCDSLITFFPIWKKYLERPFFPDFLNFWLIYQLFMNLCWNWLLEYPGHHFWSGWLSLLWLQSKDPLHDIYPRPCFWSSWQSLWWLQSKDPLDDVALLRFLLADLEAWHILRQCKRIQTVQGSICWWLLFHPNIKKCIPTTVTMLLATTQVTFLFSYTWFQFTLFLSHALLGLLALWKDIVFSVWHCFFHWNGVSYISWKCLHQSVHLL